MEEIKIYHNTRCSKSRSSCQLLTEKGIEFETVEYLKTSLTKAEIAGLLSKLKMTAYELIRKGEPAFKENFQGKTLSETEWIDAMIAYPILIQRPIIVKGDKAVIGRPTERVIDLIGGD